MAVLGQIRQRSVFLILVIGMALFAFVISGVFDGNSAAGSPSDPIAVVNDEEIELTFYRQLVENTERNYNISTMQAVNSVWDQLVRATIFRQEFERLGIDAGKEQIEMILMQDQRIVQDPRFLNETGFLILESLQITSTNYVLKIPRPMIVGKSKRRTLSVWLKKIFITI